MSSVPPWPVVAGSYQVGDPQAPIAVCVTTSERLLDPIAHLPGVAITGKVYTANLGIERIVTNITANPAIRFLLLCGKDSPLFHPGQSLVALAERGIDAEQRIIDAQGYDPFLPSLTPAQIAQFRRQVEVIDWLGEEDVAVIARRIGELAARTPGRFITGEDVTAMAPQEDPFTIIRPGGQRELLQYDPKGYFVITLDRDEEQIVLRHYLPDHTPAHEMRGRIADSMLLGLVREGLVSQLSHAGYLGEELAKAQTALLLNLRYEQDRPLKARENAAPTVAETLTNVPPPTSEPANMPSRRQIPMPFTLAQLQAATPGTTIDIVFCVTDQPAPDLLTGIVLAPDEADPFSTFQRTSHPLRVQWSSTTKLIMGDQSGIHIDAVLRVRGSLSADQVVTADQLVILNAVARITEAHIMGASEPG